jgi:hypothetical protein
MKLKSIQKLSLVYRSGANLITSPIKIVTDKGVDHIKTELFRKSSK